MKKFRNKYRIPSARLPDWDYRNAGAYFITICTHNRAPIFGECTQGKMKLTTAGMIAQGCWYQIPYLNPHVSLGAFVVMPNHVHGVLILDDMGDGVDGVDNGNRDGDGVETFESNVSTSNVVTPNADPDFETNNKTNMVGVSINNDNKNTFYQNISPKSGSVSRMIQQYKTVCTKHIRLVCPEINFEWQTRFYDHIIRNEVSFANITNYILQNPVKWDEDRFYKRAL